MPVQEAELAGPQQQRVDLPGGTDDRQPASTAAGASIAANLSFGRPMMNSAASARSRTISTVTIESMPPPNGTSGRPVRVRLPLAARAHR